MEAEDGSYLSLIEGNGEAQTKYYFRMNGNWLLYFTDNNSTKVEGEISLDEYSKMANEQRRELSFQLTQDPPNPNTTYILKAKTEKEYDTWHAEILKVQTKIKRTPSDTELVGDDVEKKGFLVVHFSTSEPKECWCRLSRGVFMIFAYIHDEIPVGSLPLAKFVLNKDPIGSVTYCFWLEHTDKKAMVKFEANSDVERQDWVSAIEACMKNIGKEDGANLAEYMDVFDEQKQARSTLWIVVKGSYLMMYNSPKAFQPETTMNLPEFYIYSHGADSFTIAKVGTGGKFVFYPTEEGIGVRRALRNISLSIGMKDPSVETKPASAPNKVPKKKAVSAATQGNKVPLKTRLLSSKSFFISLDSYHQGYLHMQKFDALGEKAKEVFCTVLGTSLCYSNSIIDSKPVGNLEYSKYDFDTVKDDSRFKDAFFASNIESGEKEIVFLANDPSDLQTWLNAIILSRNTNSEKKKAKFAPSGKENDLVMTQSNSDPSIKLPDSLVPESLDVKTAGSQQLGELSEDISEETIVEATHSYIGKGARRLTFDKGDLLKVRKMVNKDWFLGVHGGVTGFGPASHVRVISSTTAEAARLSQSPLSADSSDSDAAEPSSAVKPSVSAHQQDKQIRRSSSSEMVALHAKPSAARLAGQGRSNSVYQRGIPAKLVEDLDDSGRRFANPTKQGPLYLQFGLGRTLNPSSRQKWVILKEEYLYYFRNEGDTELLGVITLSSYSVKADAKTKKKHAFILEHNLHTEEDLLCQAFNIVDCEEWCEALQGATKNNTRGAEKKGPSGTLPLEKEKGRLMEELEMLRSRMGNTNTKYFKLATSSQEKFRDYVSELQKEKKAKTEIAEKVKELEVELRAMKSTDVAVVKYSWEKTRDIQLSLRKGEQITILDKLDSGWWQGRNDEGESGWFPSSFAEEYQKMSAIGTQTEEIEDVASDSEMYGMRNRIKELESAIQAEEGRRLQIGNIVLNYVKPEIEKAREEVAEEKSKNEVLGEKIRKMEKVISALKTNKHEHLREMEVVNKEMKALRSERERLHSLLKKGYSGRSAAVLHAPSNTYRAVISRSTAKDKQLSFKQNEEIKILEMDDASGFWKGVSEDGNIGWFPPEYVELAAKSKETSMKSKETVSKSLEQLVDDESSTSIPRTSLARADSSSPPIRSFMSRESARRRRPGKDPYNLSLRQKLDMFEAAARSFRT